MTSEEYEDYVEEVIRQLDFWKGAKVSRNKTFPGVRQPGYYEIDIAFELFLSELIFLRLIIECKNYSRPVTRPVVQQFAQTRDAINAQKAAIVSPSGFSKEAIEVARDLGIALWVIAKDIPIDVVMAFWGLKIMGLSEFYYRLRASYLNCFGIQVDSQPMPFVNIVNTLETSDLSLVRDSSKVEDFLLTTAIKGENIPNYCHFYRGVRGGSGHFTYLNHPLFDENCALLQVVNWAFQTVGDSIFRDEDTQRKLHDWENELMGVWQNQVETRFRSAEVVDKAISYVKNNEQKRFFELLW